MNDSVLGNRIDDIFAYISYSIFTGQTPIICFEVLFLCLIWEFDYTLTRLINTLYNKIFIDS